MDSCLVHQLCSATKGYINETVKVHEYIGTGIVDFGGESWHFEKRQPLRLGVKDQGGKPVANPER